MATRIDIVSPSVERDFRPVVYSHRVRVPTIYQQTVYA